MGNRSSPNSRWKGRPGKYVSNVHEPIWSYRIAVDGNYLAVELGYASTGDEKLLAQHPSGIVACGELNNYHSCGKRLDAADRVGNCIARRRERVGLQDHIRRVCDGVDGRGNVESDV